MGGALDGMRLATTGLRVHQILQDIAGQNIANASNENYTRQEVRLQGLGVLADGDHFLGQGVEVAEIVRIRDTLLDEQLREAKSSSARYEVENSWLSKIEQVFNEPSDDGISANLSKFWEAWSELSSDPESFATRSNVMSRTENLTSIINNLSTKLQNLADDADQIMLQSVDAINAIFAEVALINKDIFQIEAGQKSNANDLRDSRDAALDRLAEYVDFEQQEGQNGMVNIFVDGHPAVIDDRIERLVAKSDTLDPTQTQLYWEFGERFNGLDHGKLSGILQVRDSIIPGVQSLVDTFASTLISQVNQIYSNGVTTEGHQLLQSRLGYEALGVTSSSDTLSLLGSGETGTLHISFYDNSGNFVRGHGVVIDDDDSLADIQAKLADIAGFNASLVSSSSNDGRLRLEMDNGSGENVLGEDSFATTNHLGGYDTSGFLSLVGFDQTAKTSNTSAAQPTLQSVDLSTLQTQLGVTSVADVRTTALGLSGQFTINAFETTTESAGKTDGHLVQQFAINVASTDTIDDIIAKINDLTALYGMSATFNGVGNTIDITSTAQTDSDHNVLLAGGTDYLRLGFANDYRSPDVPADEPPATYNGVGDNIGLYAQLQLNTLLMGSNASDIALDDRISSASDVNAGQTLGSAENDMAIAMAELQHSLIAGNNRFTIGQSFQNIVSDVGIDIQQSEHLLENESLMLEGFLAERDRISGVSLDEELAKMIQFQRAFEANARMFNTFNQMVEEILRLA